MIQGCVTVLGRGEDRQLESLLEGKSQLLMADSVSAALESAARCEARLIMIDAVVLGDAAALEACRICKEQQDAPVVILSDETSLNYKMQAYEAGCDDFLTRDAMFELKARLNQVLFNKVANDQLRLQLKQANEMAFIAMSDTSDLGVNIQFLLDVNLCTNLDELGMRLHQALASYGLNGSLQMRGRYAVKNMEANGMAKEMASVLLSECRNRGRYLDFGRRSIMNYDKVSLLVKNMPVDDANKYGAIKDNVFSLLQGCNARIEALDNLQSLALESELVKRLSHHLRSVMTHVDESYQEVMRCIADVVENMADGVESSIQFLGMDEQQEAALQKIMENGISDTNRIFSDGMRLDEGLKGFLAHLDEVLSCGKADPQMIQSLLNRIPGNSTQP